MRYDEAYGWHGTLKTIDIGQVTGPALADIPAYGNIEAVGLAVALDVSDAAIRISNPYEDSSGAVVADRRAPASLRRTGPAGQAAGQGLIKPGDVFMSNRSQSALANIACVRFRKCPKPPSRWIPLQAACWRWSADFRSTSPNSIERRAQRQPGSSFKPFVYAAALDQRLRRLRPFGRAGHDRRRQRSTVDSGVVEGTSGGQHSCASASSIRQLE